MNRILSLSLVLSLAAPAYAQDEQVKLAVLDLRDKGVGADLVSNLTDVVTVTLTKLGVFGVLSRADIQKMLEFEVGKQAMGCDDASCLAEIGGALGVALLVSGSIGKVGDSFIINLELTDTKTVEVMSREQRSAPSENELTAQLEGATRFLVRKLLEGQQGDLILTTSESGADVEIDGRIIGVTPLGRQTLPGGPHVVKVVKKGFITWARDVEIGKDAPTVVEASLVPSIEFIEEYDSGAFTWRLLAWTTGGIGLGMALAGLGGWAGILAAQSDYERELRNAGCSNDDPNPPPQGCGDYQSWRDTLESTFPIAVAGVAVGAALMATSAFFFLQGPEVGVYDRYKSSGTSVAIGVTPTLGGAAASAHVTF